MAIRMRAEWANIFRFNAASMHGTARRLAMRDFTVWPVGAEFMSAEAQKQFEQRQKEEKAKMWDHSQK